MTKSEGKKERKKRKEEGDREEKWKKEDKTKAKKLSLRIAVKNPINN